MCIINWINSNNTLINLFSTFVVAVATVFYVILTIRLVSENVKNRRLQTDPKIVMDIALDATRPFILHFILENIGNGVALNINFNIEDEIIFKNSKKLSDYGFIRNGLKSLSGKTRYKTFLINTMQEDLDIFKKLIIINIIYEDILKRKYKDKIIFDLSYLSDIIYSHTEPEHEVIKQLSDIATSLKSISKKINNR